MIVATTGALEFNQSAVLTIIARVDLNVTAGQLIQNIACATSVGGAAAVCDTGTVARLAGRGPAARDRPRRTRCGRSWPGPSGCALALAGLFLLGGLLGMSVQEPQRGMRLVTILGLVAAAVIIVAVLVALVLSLYHASGASHGMATFTLYDPAEQTGHLRWPEGVRVRELRVAGRLLTPAVANNRCAFELAPNNERQTVEVIFGSELPAESRGGNVPLAAPFLDGIDFGETIWRVYNTTTQASATLDSSPGLPPLTAVNREVPTAFDIGAVAPDALATRFAFAGNAPQIIVRYASTGKASILGRWLAATLLAIGGIFLARAPQARLGTPAAPVLVIAGIMAGLAWAIWLAPASIGALMALSSVVAGYWRVLEKSLSQRQELAAGETTA